ncbi:MULTISPECIES: cobalt-precorrin-5B (C(1))-methyltransferase [Anaeromyxobacter]|uniref:cobalt-precorrin-5B (C(1))-methyltransferase n=1 Tax=Anaeromyxobacter TaxID=161492 RepID=UPI001F57796D|nr:MULTISPECIES: cobalt-precorrin-5B (C(1))-methyltransferase [unclassified Anaeromyxobacter]
MTAHANDRPATAGLRTGYTTGACAAAAARAAARYLVRGTAPREIGIVLPNGRPASFPVAHAEIIGAARRCAVEKDAGDDPDVTHGAWIVADVEPAPGGVEIRGGPGVATVTRPGLGLEVGAPAINPVPRRNISDMVRAELAGSAVAGARVTVSVPRGEEIARGTMNARLGLLGGISILGTTGVVRPFSTAAWQASVAAAIDVARARALDTLVLTTGGRTEAHAMRLRPGTPEAAFIQVGDAVGAALRHAARRGIARVELVAMVGKMSKLAAGSFQIHASRSEVDLGFLAAVTAELGAAAAVLAEVAAANTAREALGAWRRAGIETDVAAALCRRAAARCAAHAPPLHVRTELVGFDGAVLGRGAAEAER